MNPAKRHAIFETLRENNPTPTTELEYTTPFELLIAVLLSLALWGLVTIAPEAPSYY